ncbi:hypothetical protein DFH06DRAFT_1437464, partial [Mycena polygramma]
MALSEVLRDSQTHDQTHATARCSTVRRAGDIPFDFDVAPGTRRYRLLNSNEPPDDAELNLIKSHMATAVLSLEHLDDEMSRLRERLAQVETKRKFLQRYRLQCEGVISPLRRMPPEVLAEIFWWTLPKVPANTRRFRTADCPWLLTHISHRWRAIATGTPR